MTPLEITVISAVIIFGFAAWLIALRASRKASVERWQKAYAEKLMRQHEDYFRQAGQVDLVFQRALPADRRLTHARNRVEFYKLELAKALKAKQGGIGIARAKLNDAVNVVLKLEAGK